MPDTNNVPRFAAPPLAGGMSFQDDDPLDPPPPAAATAGGVAPNGGLVLKAQPEFPALGRGASWDKFAVLVDATAPSDVARAPLDLVTVLDVSGSMKGQKLQLVKRAMCFVIDQLGPADRLSVVVFSNSARRVTRLARMDAAGKAAAKQAVELLVPEGGTNIGYGLRVGADVLFARRQKNAVAAVILLSDGHDTVLAPDSAAGELYDGERRRFLVLVYVPRARAAESSTRLVKVTCAYRDAATGQAVNAAAPAVVIQRPAELDNMPAPAIEVERERVRLAAADGIAAARAAADGGQHAGAARILDARLREVELSAPGAAGDDPTCEAIKEELRDLSARVGDRDEYNQTGRACLLAGMSAHAQQRAAGVEVINSSPATAAGKATAAARAYLTPKMEEMVELSRESSRKRGSGSQQASRQDAIKHIKQDLTEDF
ncbi:unnamed protein product [Urochloa decumbens]|uniref:VWFA domain-containing protein n=1 Tax=Urochloa decumbens TaxID=240449 RepID=A0ABC8YEH0_9POAL